MIGNMLVVAKNEDSDTLVPQEKKSPGRKSNLSRRSKDQRFGSNGPTPQSKKKQEHFGEIPNIPQKVVEVVQLDVVESYGPTDEVNSQNAKSKKRIVAAK